jgi:hypothetical protein
MNCNYDDVCDFSIYRFFCADEEEVKRRVMRIFSWCVDIVRCVPVGGCQLELI